MVTVCAHYLAQVNGVSHAFKVHSITRRCLIFKHLYTPSAKDSFGVD